MTDLKTDFVQQNQIHETWPLVKKMLEECIQLDDGNVWIEDVYALIRSGQAQLHIATCLHLGVVACAVGQVHLDPWDGERTYLVLYGHAVHKFIETNPYMEGVAKSMACSRIAFRSPRLGWFKRAKEMGYEVSYVQFDKRL